MVMHSEKGTARFCKECNQSVKLDIIYMAMELVKRYNGNLSIVDWLQKRYDFMLEIK